MTHLRTLVLLVLSLCPTSWMLAQASQNLSSDSTIIHKKLPNGFSYFLHRDTASRGKKIALRLVVKAGSLQEAADQKGYAHFVEHMGFNGTQHFTQEQLFSFFKKTGVQFGADANASTGFDRTFYKLDIPADSTAFLQEALLVLSDWAQGMLFLPTEVEKEKGVILAERRMNQNPQARFSEKAFNWFFQKDTLWLQHKPLGDSSLVMQANAEKLHAFYQTWYRPELMALIVTGNFDPTVVEPEIGKLFQGMPSSDNPRSTSAFRTQFRGHRNTFIYPELPLPFFMANLAFELPKAPGDFSPNQFIHNLAQEHFIETLVNSELQKDPINRTAGANLHFQINHDLGQLRYFQLICAGNPQFTEPILRSALKPLFKLAKGYLSDATFASIQKRLLHEAKRSKYSEAEIDDLALERAHEFIDAFVYDVPYGALVNRFDLLGKEYTKINKAEILAAAQHWLNPERQMLMLAMSEANKSQVPDSTRLWNWVDSTLQNLVLDTQQIDPIKPWLTSALPPVVKIACQKDHAYAIREIHYANGVKVAIKSLEGEPRVYFNADSYGGLDFVPAPQKMAGKMLQSIIDQSGVGAFSPEELAERKANLDLHYYVSLISSHETIGGSSPTEHFRDLMALLHLGLSQPRFDQKALDHALQEQLFQESNKKLFIHEILETVHRQQVPNPEPQEKEYSYQELQNLQLNDLEKVYQDRFCNPADFEFVFVGDASLDSLQAMIDPYLGNLPTVVTAAETYKMRKQTDLKPKPVLPIDTTLYVLDEAKAGVEINYLTTRKSKPYPEYLHYLFYLGDELEAILTKELREKRGAIYHVSVQTYSNEWRTGFRVLFECSSERITELEAVADSCIQFFCTKTNLENLVEEYQRHNQNYKKRDPEVRDHNYWEIQLQNHFSYLDRLDFTPEDKLDPDFSFMPEPKLPNIKKFQQFWKRLVIPAKKSRIILLPKTNQVN